MKFSASGYRCLVYLPHSYSGRGPAETCRSLLPGIQAAGLATTVYAPRLRKPFAREIPVVQTLPAPIRSLPFSLIGSLAKSSLDRAFVAALKRTDPARTIAYFWPDASLHVVRAARDLGIATVREMINNPVAVAGPLLDIAYARFGVAPAHAIDAAKIAAEARELPLYDHYFTSNGLVGANLAAIGLNSTKILSTSYGWRPDRFINRTPEAGRGLQDGLRVLYVGTVDIRKGVPELLEAWGAADVAGTLILAGALAPELAELVARHVRTGRVEHRGFVEDIGALYRSADLFVFPSHEEGGPQVTIEAGACDLPVICTPMGAGGFVEDGINGIIVPPGDVEALAAAIQGLARSPDTRDAMARASAAKAPLFDYAEVGLRRGRMLADVLAARALRTSGRA